MSINIYYSGGRYDGSEAQNSAGPDIEVIDIDEAGEETYRRTDKVVERDGKQYVVYEHDANHAS